MGLNLVRALVWKKHVHSSRNSTSFRQPTNRSNPTFGLIANDLLVFPLIIYPMILIILAQIPQRQSKRRTVGSTQYVHQLATELSSDVGRPTQHERLRELPTLQSSAEPQSSIEPVYALWSEHPRSRLDYASSCPLGSHLHPCNAFARSRVYAVCTFSEVSGIFQLFTSHHHLLIFAPTDCPLSVEDLFICLHPETISVHAIPCTKGMKICIPLASIPAFTYTAK